MVQPIPAPSLRELSSEARLRECTSVNVTAQNYRVYMRWWETVGMEEPSGYTPSVTPIRACQLPQGGSREGGHHSTCRPETATLRAIFIAPTKTQKPVPFTIHRGTLPQSRPVGVTAPSGREPGLGAYHSTCRPEGGRLRAIFIAPTKAQNVLHFTIHRGRWARAPTYRYKLKA